MITYVVSDLFKSPARVIVNTVNTVGVMGKGIAKDFKLIYPEMFNQYQRLCEKEMFEVGQLWLYKTKHKWVLNFPTKRHWRGASKLEYIEAGLEKFSETYAEKGISSISFPMLGCGNGGLDWKSQVQPVMEKYLKNLPIDIYIHLYRKDPFESEHRDINKIKKWLRSEPESLAFIEVWDDLKNMLEKQDSFFTLKGSIGFTASITDEPEQSIMLKTAGKQFFIHKEQLVDLWQHIRSLGFCMDSSMPHGLERFTPYIVTIFRNLPYLKPVLISSSYKNIEERDPIGLQFIPDSSNEEQVLYKQMNEVESSERN